MTTFLESGHTVQYLAASRHPSELITALRSQMEQMPNIQWQDKAQNIVVVDAFTPHFGFTDSIHDARTRHTKSLGVECINSSVSYAGLHTASSRAFNVIKARARSEVRGPTLVVYEDTHALADLESHEQYRIFVRHVIPSERMWDGMFTVFAEIAPENRDWDVLRAYGGICIDRHSPYTIQIRGNRTTFPPPRNCIPYAAIRWHDFGNRPALGRPLGHFSRHPDTPLLSLSPRRRFPRPTPERVFVADHQSSSGFSGTGPSAPPPQPIGT